MLNVFIAIIPLLLMSAAFVQVSVIQASLPAEAAAPVDTPADVALDLTVTIHDDAYIVEAAGVPTSTVPRTAGAVGKAATDARHQLAAVLEAIAQAHPDNHAVRIVAQPTTHYEDIIDVMDVARAAGLPDAALADAGTEAS